MIDQQAAAVDFTTTHKSGGWGKYNNTGRGVWYIYIHILIIIKSLNWVLARDLSARADHLPRAYWG